MKISDVSERLGIPASTIRYYEKVGLINRQMRVSGRRKFDSQDIISLEFVLLAQSAGFTIAEIKRLVNLNVENPVRSETWMEMAKEQQSRVSREIKNLKSIEQVLIQMLSCSCKDINDCLELSKSDHV